MISITHNFKNFFWTNRDNPQGLIQHLDQKLADIAVSVRLIVREKIRHYQLAKEK